MYRRLQWPAAFLALSLSSFILFAIFSSPALTALEGQLGDGFHAGRRREGVPGEILVYVRMVNRFPSFTTPLGGMSVSLIDTKQRNETNTGIVATTQTSRNGLAIFTAPAGKYEVKLQFTGVESSAPAELGDDRRRVSVEWTFIREALRDYRMMVHDALGSGMMVRGDSLEVLFPSRSQEHPTFLELYFNGSTGISVGQSIIGALSSRLIPSKLNRLTTILVLDGSTSSSWIWVKGTPEFPFQREELEGIGEPALAAYWLVNRVVRLR